MCQKIVRIFPSVDFHDPAVEKWWKIDFTAKNHFVKKTPDLKSLVYQSKSELEKHVSHKIKNIVEKKIFLFLRQLVPIFSTN